MYRRNGVNYFNERGVKMNKNQMLLFLLLAEKHAPNEKGRREIREDYLKFCNGEYNYLWEKEEEEQ